MTMARSGHMQAAGGATGRAPAAAYAGPVSGAQGSRAQPDRRAALLRWLPAAPAALMAVLGGVLVAQRQGLWYDELYTAEVARAPLADLLAAVVAGEGTAPYIREIPPSYNAPYYLVVHLWLAATRLPADDLGLRLLSLSAAVIAVAVLTRAVGRLAGARVGLTAGLLAAGNPFVVEYAAEARGYGLALLATAATALGLARWLDGRGLAVYALGAAAMGLAHWFAVPVLAGLALSAVALRGRTAVPLLGVTALAALPVAALVALAAANGAGGDNVGFIRDTGGAVPWLALEAWTAGSSVLLSATLGAVALGLWRGGRTAVVAAGWVAVPVLAVTAAELVRPVFVPRYLLPALLGLAVLAGLGVATWRRPVAAGLSAALLACSLWAGLPLLERGPRENGRAAVGYLMAQHVPGEPVVAADPRAALALAHYGQFGGDLRLPPRDAPRADAVWVLRFTTPQGLAPSDDDVLLSARGLRVVQQRVFPGSNTDLVVQRWER
jgi:mannosyltransferase